MGVYIAYSDEAGIGDPQGEFLVGGYIAEESVWADVVVAWQERVLDGPPSIPIFTCRRFGMSIGEKGTA